jgi:glycosyltransferase involved in cell wall biosynthesis
MAYFAETDRTLKVEAIKAGLNNAKAEGDRAYNDKLFQVASAEYSKASNLFPEKSASCYVDSQYIKSRIRICKKMVVEFHEVVDPLENSILPIRVYPRVMGKLIRKLATHYVVHSEADRELIGRIYKIPKEKISIIPHGIYDHYEKVDNAREKLKTKEDFVILFFGLLRPYKGVKYLIKAFEMLPEEVISKSRLLIVGETWEDRESVKIAEESPCRDKITIINRYVPDDEVSLYFSASDVVVLPYTRASQSGVAHIAMSFGLPIIATNVGGLKESLSGYGGTSFVEVANVNEIRDAIVRVFRNRRRYDPPDYLTWDNIAIRWLDLLGSI